MFRRGFCSLDNQMKRHGQLACSRELFFLGLAGGIGAGAGAGGLILMQSGEIKDLKFQVIEVGAELKESKEATHLLNNKYTREKTELEGVIGEKESEIEQKDSEIESKVGEIASRDQTIQQKVEALETKEHSLKQTKNKLNKTSQEHSKLQRRHKDLKAIKSKLTGDLKNCVNTKETKLQKAQRENAELKEKLAIFNKQSNSLEKVVGSLRDEIRFLKLSN